MNIVQGLPPNFRDIVAVFPLARRPGTMFCFGDVIYVNGSPSIVTPALKAHESVHVDQQRRTGGPALWWRRYLEDPAWRLEQELPAHRAEYATLKHLDRNLAARARNAIAERLSSPLYGGMISKREALQALLR